MNTIKLNIGHPVYVLPESRKRAWSKPWLKWNFKPMLLLLALLSLYFAAPYVVSSYDSTAASIDQSIWLLIILSQICFLLIISLAWWLLEQVWKVLKLPLISIMVSSFNTLPLWQQLSFFLASFALVLLAALVSLSAVL